MKIFGKKISLKKSLVNGDIEFYDKSSCSNKTYKTTATNSEAHLHWKNWGSCSTILVKLQDDGTIKNICKGCGSPCSKPYGDWRWRKI